MAYTFQTMNHSFTRLAAVSSVLRWHHISWFIICLLPLLTSCAATVYEQPLVIHENTHSGGSVVVFNHSGSLLASGGWEGNLRLWKLPSGEQLRRWPAHGNSINGIAFTRDDSEILTAGYDGRLIKWTLGGAIIRQIDSGSPVTHMQADVDRNLVLTGHRDGSVRVWRLTDLEQLVHRVLHRASVKAVAIDPVSGRFASADSAGQVLLWSANGAIQVLSAPPVDAWTLEFSPDGQWLLGGGWFDLFRWRLQDGTLRILPTEHQGIIQSIQYNRTSNQLASISRQTDSAVYLLDPASGKVMRRFKPHDLCGASVSVSADGHYLATTSDDASVRIWDLSAPVK